MVQIPEAGLGHGVERGDEEAGELLGSYYCLGEFGPGSPLGCPPVWIVAPDFVQASRSPSAKGFPDNIRVRTKTDCG